MTNLSKATISAVDVCLRPVRHLTVIIYICLNGMAGVADADMIINGSFEQPALDHAWAVYPSIEGWNTISGPGIEVQDNVAGASYLGSQHVELDSHANSAMEQLVDTVSGMQYTLDFAYSPRPNVVSASNSIEVYWNNMLLDTMSGSTPGSTLWSVHNYTLMGFGDNTSLKFAAAGTSDSLGGYIDAVSLNPVPEPATMFLFGTGLIGFATVRRRRRV